MMQISFFDTVVRAAALPLFGSRYLSQHIEKALRDMFGSDRSIADYSAADTIGAMVGMTVATVQDASACIFTSYNGVGQRAGDRGSLPVPVEAIRSPRADADGLYFTPWSIGSLGTFQDGGLVANSPSSIALQKVASLFPEAPHPSLLASMGTGSSPSSSGGGWWDCFLLRLARASRNRNKNDWQRVVAQKKLGRSGEFFRFDVEFDGSEPPMSCVLRGRVACRLPMETADEGRDISGSPFTVLQLVRSQKLEQCFGTSDHRTKRQREDDNDEDEGASRKQPRLMR
ncbi:hypothetical protein CaCOL14_012804 [Colletotrichum acutatum]